MEAGNLINKKEKIKGISLFSSAGIGELYFDDINIDIVVANELIPKRAELYKHAHLNADMIVGDICNEDVFKNIVDAAKKHDINFMLISPPCQGFSVAGKNRSQKSIEVDNRNYLILQAIKIIKEFKPDYIIIENVPTFLTAKLLINKHYYSLEELLDKELGDVYNIDAKVLDAADYGIPQHRKRAITKLYKKDLKWEWPLKQSQKVSVMEAIGHLPSLESGQKSNIKWHYARKHSEPHIKWLQHTPTGKSAFDNKEFYPQKLDGTPIKGYNSSYRRIRWEEPAPTITMRNDAISSQRNVHPGRLKEDGTYSDARVLTPLELMIINSMPIDWNIPADTPEILIRQCIGESIPPLLLKQVAGTING